MRTFLFAVTMALVCAGSGLGQAVRFDGVSYTTSASCVSGKQCQVLSLPGTAVSVCQGTAASLTACLSSLATTYTSASAGTACATTSQLTPATGGACLSTADNQGNFGAWLLPGSYSYYLRVPATAGGGTYGPYPINLGASAGCPSGATCDANYATLALACTAAGSGTLYVTRAWNATPTQTCSCKLNFLGNGKIAMATSAVLTTGVPTAAANQQIFDTSASGASVAVTGPGDLQMGWWGADPTGVTETGVAQQAALTACSGGQKLISGRGVYKTATHLSVPAYCNWDGVGADFQSGQAARGGATFLYSGTSPASPYVAGSGVINVTSKYGTRIRGINIDCGGITNVSGYVLGTDNVIPSQRQSFTDTMIQNCGNPSTGAAGAGMVLGTGTVGGGQVDGNDIARFHITNSLIGMRIYSANFDYSRVEVGAIDNITTGVDIQYSGDVKFSHVTAGSFVGSGDCQFFYIEGPYDPISLTHTQAENTSCGGTTYHVRVASGLAGQVNPMNWDGGNTFNLPSLIASQSKIFSAGNVFTASVSVTGDNVGIFEAMDSFVGGATINITGVNSQRIPFPSREANGTVMTWDNPFTVNQPNQHFNTLASSGKSSDYNTFSLGGQDWAEAWSATQFCLRDITGSDFDVFCAAAGLTSAQKINLTANKATVSGVDISSRQNGRTVHYFATQSGSNNAITVVTADTSWQPSEGDMLSINLANNSLQAAGANTISVNGGTAHPVLKSTTSATLGTAYAVGGSITVVLDGGGSFRAIGQ